MRIGLISDTHGKLRNEVFDHFGGVEGILHAGDIGPMDLLVELGTVAPVTAVYGNTDGHDVRSEVPEVAELEVDGLRVVVVHGHQLGSPTPAGLVGAHRGADVIVYGHTHRPLVEEREGVLVVNPGAAGAARFGIPPSLALLDVSDGEPRVELIQLRR